MDQVMDYKYQYTQERNDPTKDAEGEKGKRFQVAVSAVYKLAACNHLPVVATPFVVNYQEVRVALDSVLNHKYAYMQNKTHCKDAEGEKTKRFLAAVASLLRSDVSKRLPIVLATQVPDGTVADHVLDATWDSEHECWVFPAV